MTIGGNLGILYYCTVDASIVQGYDNGIQNAGYKNWGGVGSTSMALTGIESCNSNALVSGYTRPLQSEIAPNVMNNTIVDCTYLTDYHGRHGQVTIDEIYNSLYRPANSIYGRYIIYA